MLIIHVCDDIRELVCVFCVREYASCVRVGTLMSLYAHSPPRVRQDLSIFSRDQQFVSNWKEDICSGLKYELDNYEDIIPHVSMFLPRCKGP